MEANAKAKAATKATTPPQYLQTTEDEMYVSTS